MSISTDHYFRQFEIKANNPIAFCCPEFAGQREIAASFKKSCYEYNYSSENPPVWRLKSSNTEVFHCPFCATKLPKLVKKTNHPKNITTKFKYEECTICKSKQYCFCDPMVNMFEAENAPPIIASTAFFIKEYKESEGELEGYKYLSVSRKHDANDKGFPGGGIEIGESPEDCMVRELKEETGLIAVKYHKIFDSIGFDTVGKPGLRVVTYDVIEYEGEINTTEKGVVEWVTREKLESGTFGRYNKALFNLYYNSQDYYD